jgi:MFS family permease
MKPRTWVLTAAAGLVLADASIVTLALPELLRALDTTVVGVAAVIGVYTVVLALALLPAERLVRARGSAPVAAAGFGLFALASLLCAVSDSLTVLLVGRAVQAIGGAAGLVAAFDLIEGGTAVGRRHWLGAAVLSSAIGPALGGALTEAFDWRAIFVVQAPIAVIAVAFVVAGERVLSLRAGGPAAGAAAIARSAGADLAGPGATAAPPTIEGSAESAASTRFAVLPSVALALLSAALTAVIFLLVLLLIAGWSISPLAAAATVSVLPLAAFGGARVRGAPLTRALAGSLSIAAGVLALAWLPDANVAWTFVPQLLAGIGMGMALPAFAGELLPERTTRDAARLLTIRHLGIALVLAILAPLASHQLDVSTERAKERGVALVLDAKLPPQDKLALAPALLSGVDAEQPRGGLQQALAAHRGDFSGADRRTYDRLAERADETLISAVAEAFRLVFLVTGGLALLAGALLLDRRRAATAATARAGASGATARAGASVATAGAAATSRGARRPGPWLAGLAALVIALPAAYAAIHANSAPAPITLADPCAGRRLPGAGGITGFLQDRALQALDATACRLHSSREELVLALADPAEAKRFEQRHGTDPRSPGSLIKGLLSP